MKNGRSFFGPLFSGIVGFSGFAYSTTLRHCVVYSCYQIEYIWMTKLCSFDRGLQFLGVFYSLVIVLGFSCTVLQMLSSFGL